MIVTRRRRKPFPWKRIAAPLLVIAVIVAAFVWAPSRDWMAKGPLSSVFRAVQPAVATFNPQNAKIAALQKQLAADNTQIEGLDKQVSTLQTQLSAAQQNVAPAPAPAPQRRVASAQNTTSAGAPGLTQSGGSDLAAQATPDMRRTASVWAAMDPEAAAKVVQRLPDYYVARIFAIMSPDSAGAILESLPPSDAARLTQDHPELQH